MRKKLPSLLLLVLLLSSCQCDKLYFNEDERYWATSYEEGDMAIFQSNLDSIKKDTIFITQKVHTLPTGECNVFVRNFDPEAYRIDYKYSHNGQMSDSNYLVQYVKDKQSSSPTIRIYDVEYNGAAFTDTTMILKNFGSQNCHMITTFQRFDNHPDFKIKNFIWSKDLGLVQITLKNGEFYQLIKKVNAKKSATKN